jgi:peptidoglycan lytic transglycosylase
MFSTSRVNKLCLKIEAGRILLDAPSFSAHFRNLVRPFAVILMTAALAACAQSSVVTNKTAFRAANRQTSVMAVNTKRHFIKHTHMAGTQAASNGLASFYSEGSQTASGEKFHPNELTAAHRTLPFGTRLRVTNVANGRSVTVRINDRGPFVAGRSVDVSYSAAARIGIIDRGVAKVKLDVVK